MPEEKMRLQKWLARQGIASRREAETWIAAGRVSVNGVVVVEQGVKVDPATDVIAVDGRPLRAAAPEKIYWMLHKPDMVLTSRASQGGMSTIYDIPAVRAAPVLLAPVGRLDFRTEGLLLLTSDGDFAYRMTHPKFKVPRSYFAKVSHPLTADQLRQLRNGITLEDGPLRGVEIRELRQPPVNDSGRPGYWYDVTVLEGRNRLVRRLFEHFGYSVLRLLRWSFGGLRLPENLRPGEVLALSQQDLQHIGNVGIRPD